MSAGMRVVAGVDGLATGDGPAFVVVGVFDGLHLGHQYLLRHLVAESRTHDARPTVITFDHHPDAIVTGHAPPLLIDPEERLERLADAGVAVTVVEHFDAVLRETAYDRYVERIRDRVALAGFLMTPDAAFGFERRGTPEALERLGAYDGFEVVVVPPFTLEGRPVRSSEIRAAIGAGDLEAASRLLGRPVTLSGVVDAEGRLRIELPMALPPEGTYTAVIGETAATVEIRHGSVRVDGAAPSRRVTLELVGR